jgi:hypothetical protein
MPVKIKIWWAISNHSRTADIAELMDFSTLWPQIKEYFSIFGTTPPSIANDNTKLRAAA